MLIWLGLSLAILEVGALPLCAGEIDPRLTSVFPPAVVIGGGSEVVVKGERLVQVDSFQVSGEGVGIRGVRPRADGACILSLKVNPDAVPGYREIRANGGFGLSNVLYLRLDVLTQVLECEPNDTLPQATPLKMGCSAVGTLTQGDLDHYQFEGKAGQRLIFELEARRLGIPITPMLTIFTDNGASLDQAGETRGCEGDCRRAFTLPADGRYIIQVRDLTYGGGEWAHYSLRMGELPFATGMFPLGGQRGQTLEVLLSGGTLERPVPVRVRLPDTNEFSILPQPTVLLGKPLPFPQRLAISEGPEVFEEIADPSAPSSVQLLPLGTTVNGRIERAGERDRYRLALKRGERVRVRLMASVLGSWLDSVVSVTDGRGKVIAENDDPPAGTFDAEPRVSLPSTDSVLEFEAPDDGEFFLEVRDRYGEGGPEYAYRLIAGPSVGDISLSLRLSHTGAVPAGMGTKSGDRVEPAASVQAINLRPSTVFPLDVVIRTEGRVGPIRLLASGLPPGVRAEPVTVRPNRPGRTESGSPAKAVIPTYARLLLRVDPEAKAGVGRLRVEGSCSRGDGSIIKRRAAIVLNLGEDHLVPPARPLIRVVEELPISVLERPQTRE